MWLFSPLGSYYFCPFISEQIRILIVLVVAIPTQKSSGVYSALSFALSLDLCFYTFEEAFHG